MGQSAGKASKTAAEVGRKPYPRHTVGSSAARKVVSVDRKPLTEAYKPTGQADGAGIRKGDLDQMKMKPLVGTPKSR